MIDELTDLRERLRRQMEACDVLLNSLIGEGAPAPARRTVMAVDAPEPEPEPRRKSGRRGSAAPPPKVGKENQRERAARGREIVLALPMPVTNAAAASALKAAGIEQGNMTNFFSALVKAGTMKKIGTGIYAMVAKPASVGEDLEARKAALGIAVKKKEED